MTIESVRYQVELPNVDATEQLGASIARVIQPGDVVLLSGELGAGKTVLTKGFVRAINPRILVTSPTFALCHLYDTEPKVAHVDCWRLRDLAEFTDLGLDEMLDEGGVAIIEWGELTVPLYASDALVIHIGEVQRINDSTQRIDDPNDQRLATLESISLRWHDRLSFIAAALDEDGVVVHHVERAPLRPT